MAIVPRGNRATTGTVRLPRLSRWITLGSVPTRLRLPDILEERGLTAYEVARRSHGRIDASALYRLVRQRGRVTRFSSELIDALCDVLGVSPGELMSRSRGRDTTAGFRRRTRHP